MNLVGLQSLNLSLQYSYDLEITKGLSFRPGVEVAIYNRSINFGRLTFGDQFDFDTGQPTNPTGESLRGSNKFFPDLALGEAIHTPRAWVGFAAHHLTQPNQSISGEVSRLPIKYSAHGGWKFFLKPGIVAGVYSRKSERSIAPAVQYRHRDLLIQMDVGMYFTFEADPAGNLVSWDTIQTSAGVQQQRIDRIAGGSDDPPRRCEAAGRTEHWLQLRLHHLNGLGAGSSHEFLSTRSPSETPGNHRWTRW